MLSALTAALAKAAVEIVLMLAPKIIDAVKHSKNNAEATVRLRQLLKREGIEAAYKTLLKELK